MATMKTLKEKIVAGELILGMSVHMGSPTIVEIMGLAGFDYVWVDTEHTPFSLETVEELVRASESAGATPIVRVYENDPHLIMRTLDAGAQGIIVPMIRTAADARRAVEASRMPPEGSRGTCAGVRAYGYSLDNWEAKVRKVNQNMVVGVIIENRDAVKNLDEILNVRGIDIIIPGPADYSQEVGLSRHHPEVQTVMRDVIHRSLAAGKLVLVIILRDLTSIPNYLTFQQMKEYYTMGVRGFMYTNDALVWMALCKDLAHAREMLAGTRL